MPESVKSESQKASDLLRRILGNDTSDRRVVIFRSLWRLMLDKGYAGTSLTDVAKEAGISPSHLVYYFSTKDEILVELFEVIADAVSTVTAHGDEPPVEQCHLLASYAFFEPILGPSERSIVLEMTGIAVHNPRLRTRHQQFVRQTMGYLTDLFAKTPRAFGLSAEDAAFLALSIWMGLITNSYFYDEFSQSRARALFRQQLLLLAGLTDPSVTSEAQLPVGDDSESGDLSVTPGHRQ